MIRASEAARQAKQQPNKEKPRPHPLLPLKPFIFIIYIYYFYIALAKIFPFALRHVYKAWTENTRRPRRLVCPRWTHCRVKCACEVWHILQVQTEF